MELYERKETKTTVWQQKTITTKTASIMKEYRKQNTNNENENELEKENGK